MVVSKRTNVAAPSLISNDDVDASAILKTEPLLGNANSDDMDNVSDVDVVDVNDVNAPDEGTENPITVLSMAPADMNVFPISCTLLVDAERRRSPDMVVTSLLVILTLSTMNGDDVCPMPNALAFVKSTFPVNAIVPPKVRGEIVLPDMEISPG